MEEEEKFELAPVISPSDNAFRNKIGTENWEKKKSQTFRDDGYKCCGCGFEPDTVLTMHIIEENEENPTDSKTNTTCQICHVIQHADVAIEKGYVELVNSFFKQGELVNICRNGELAHHIEKGEIRYIKKDLQVFLEELKSGRSKEGKVKFILTEKYLNSIGIH